MESTTQKLTLEQQAEANWVVQSAKVGSTQWSKNPALRPIVPRQNIYLRESPLIDGERFARLFKEVWQRISLGARRHLLRNFREGQSFESDLTGGPSPAIVITPYYPDCGESDLESAVGQWTGQKWGRQRGVFSFWAHAVNILPDEHLRTLIAHELCHCFVDEVGGDTLDEYMVRNVNDEFFGSDEYALSAWMNDNGELLDVQE
jgi:hypothetical protein